MEINKVDFFSDNTKQLSTNYDFNKDGTVDIQDYNFALLSLDDDDPDNDIELSKDELKEIFAELIEEDDKVNPDNVNVNQDNVTKLSQDVVEEAAKNLTDPSKANSFTELQEVGKNLSKIIKRCTKLLPYLNQQMEEYSKRLETISKEKEAKEEDYAELSDTVNSKNELLAEKMDEAMLQSENVTDEMRKNTSKIIADCVERYKNGEFEGQDLLSVITSGLANDSNSAASVSALNSVIADCGSLGDEIKSICGDIETLVADIRSVTQQFNMTTNMLNSLKESRNNVLDTSNNASAQYQKGYERRQELRQAISEQYGSGTAGLKAFLNSQDSTSIPFADAYAVMANIAKDTGISFTNGNIIMPNFIYYESESEITDEQRAQMKEFNEISDIINQKYASSGNSSNSSNSNSSSLSNLAALSGLSSMFKTGDANDDEDLNLDDEDLAFGDDLEFDDESTDEISEEDLESVSADDISVDDTELDEEEFCTGEPTCLGCCTQSQCCDPISFKQGNTSYHFVSDNDKDGTFDGASEFLGAKNGWDEMKAYDANGDGKINGDELEKLNLVSMNDDNGQYTFMSAAEAGIEEIDLSSYQKKNEKQTDGDTLQGTFSLKMTDGSVIQGEQTDDTMKNIENRYSSLIGAKIEDLSDDYEDNPFMDDFQETVDTGAMTSTNTINQDDLEKTSETNIENIQDDANSNARHSAEKTTEEKKVHDRIEAEKEENARLEAEKKESEKEK